VWVVTFNNTIVYFFLFLILKYNQGSNRNIKCELKEKSSLYIGINNKKNIYLTTLKEGSIRCEFWS